jgi:hypothetical protein
MSVAVPGGSFQGQVALCAMLPAPAVVVLREVFGVNDELRATYDELAIAGYIAPERGLSGASFRDSRCGIGPMRRGRRGCCSTRHVPPTKQAGFAAAVPGSRKGTVHTPASCGHVLARRCCRALRHKGGRARARPHPRPVS